MIVDVVTEKGVQWARYTTDRAPMVGETISTLQPEVKTFTVLSVDHLIAPSATYGEMRQQLVTVTVREN